MNLEEKYNALAALVENYRRERDEARAKFDHECLRNVEVMKLAQREIEHWKQRARFAYSDGAEAMREAAANALHMAGHGTLCDTSECEHWGRYVRALPIPEEP